MGGFVYGILNWITAWLFVTLKLSSSLLYDPTGSSCDLHTRGYCLARRTFLLGYVYESESSGILYDLKISSALAISLFEVPAQAHLLI